MSAAKQPDPQLEEPDEPAQLEQGDPFDAWANPPGDEPGVGGVHA